MPRCYLALGSNLNSPKRQLSRALSALQRLPKLMITQRSKIYFNPPMGVKAQPMFYNMVISLDTSLSPTALLKACQRIEQHQQRVRKKKWGARTIDIDILFYGDQVIRKHNLMIPHPEWFKRDFVCIPLAELQRQPDHVRMKQTSI